MDNNQENENLILKKRLYTCRTAKSFYVSIGVKKQQLASIIKKGKRLFKDSSDKLGPFVPIEVKQSESNYDFFLFFKSSNHYLVFESILRLA